MTALVAVLTALAAAVGAWFAGRARGRADVREADAAYRAELARTDADAEAKAAAERAAIEAERQGPGPTDAEVRAMVDRYTRGPAS